MVAAAPIVVHVVEANTALYTVAGTLGGVVVGAVAAWLRQRSQVNAERDRLDRQLEQEEERLGERLEEDRKRLKDQLDAAADRLHEQLAHDREMKEREALRAALDEALEAGRLAFIACCDAVEQTKFGHSAFDVRPLVIAGSKLLIRLGRTHPVQQRFLDVRDELADLDGSIAAPTENPGITWEQCQSQLSAAEAALKAFVDSAAGLVGSPLAGLGA